MFWCPWIHANTFPLGQDINWPTTRAWVDHDDIVNMAHQHGARTMIAAPKIEYLTALEDSLQ